MFEEKKITFKDVLIQNKYYQKIIGLKILKKSGLLMKKVL